MYTQGYILIKVSFEVLGHRDGADAYSLGRVAAAIGVEGQLEVAGYVDEVKNSVFHGVLLEVLGVLKRVWQGSSPVTVCTSLVQRILRVSASSDSYVQP